MRSSKCPAGPVSTEVAAAHHQARSSTDFPSQLLAVDEAPLLQELQPYIVPIADAKMRAENPVSTTTALLLIICLPCHMTQLLGRVQE